MKQEEKPLSRIAIRCLTLLDAVQKEAMDKTIREAAESMGLNLDDGWVLKPDASAFVKPEKADGSD